MDKYSRLLKREGGFADYISILIILPILLAVIVGGGYVAKSLQMMSTLNHALTIVDSNMKQNGALTTEGQNQLISYLQKNKLDLGKVYLNATTATQSFGSRGLEATIGYDFDLYAPGTSHVVWHKYYEVSMPMAQSQLIPGSGADSSGSVELSSIFAGIQGGTSSGGSGSSSTPTNIATSMTLQASNNSPVVNAPVIVSGNVFFGSNSAPAGTLVVLNGGGIIQNVSTDSTGAFTASVTFSQPGTVQLQASSGTATASVSLSVQANSPETIILQVPTTVQVGDPFTVTGTILDNAGNTVMDGTVVTISSSNTTDIPTTTVTTQAWSFTYTVNKITSLGPINITASAGTASTTQNITVIPGDPKSISLNMSSTSLVVGSSITFSGQVLGPYGTPPTQGTPVTIMSGTDLEDTLPTLSTDANGNFSGTATLTKAGDHAFYAQTEGPIISSTLTATVTAGSPYKVQGIVGTPNRVNMGASLSLSGYVSDQYNNPVASGTSLEITSSTLPSSVSTSVLSGAFNGRVTLQSPGVQTLSIKDTSGNALSGGSLSVNVLPTAAYTLTPTQDLYSIKAGQSIGNVEFTLKDSNGEPVAGKALQFSETPQGAVLITPTSAVTDSQGRVQTTVGSLTTAGSHTIAATLVGDSSVVGTVGINVSPGSPHQVISSVSPSTTQVWTSQDPVPLPIVSGTISDAYGNPIIGATVTISGGYGANVTGTTGANGYYALSIKPLNVGGPFALSFSVTCPTGNYNTIQGNLTVTEPIVVPVDKVLEGTTIAGQTGTMPNMVTANPNGMGVGRSSALQYWTGGGSTVYLKPQKGYYDGIDTWTYYYEPNLVSTNIKNGVTILGVEGTYVGGAATHGSQVYATPGTFTFTVPAGVTSINAIIIGAGGGGGSGEGRYDNDGAGAGGGSGGAYIDTFAVTPGQVLSVVVGAGGIASTTTSYGPGTSGGDGGNSSVDGYVAYGGKGGLRANLCGYSGAGGGAGGSGGGAAGYTGQTGTHGYAPSGSHGSYTGDQYGKLGGKAPGNGGSGGNPGAGSAGANGRVTILW